MRKVSLVWYLSSALLLLACSDGNTNGGGCPSGTENCNGQCVASGSCTSSTSPCPIGNELCDGLCVPSGTCTGSGCAVGQIVCNNACYTGTTCPASTVIPSGVGGSSHITVNVGGNSSVAPVTGGKSASGGTTAVAGGKTSTGGKSSTGGTTAYTDPDPSKCTDSASISATLKTQWQKLSFVTSNNPSKNYYALANWWSVYNGQTVALNGLGFTVSNSKGATSSNGSDPIGYPAFMIGQYQEIKTMGSGLPIQVSAIKSVPVVFNTNINSVSGDLNASMDVWFNTSSSPLNKEANRPTGGYLMVWQNKPNSKQPRGSQVMDGVTIPNVSGTWNVWADNECVSYVATSTQASLTFDLNEFIKHAVKNNKIIQNSWYLADIFAGFEIWNGGNGAQLKQFCAKVN